MRALKAVFKLRLRLSLQYRTAAAAGIVTQFFFGFVMIMIFEAFYRGDAAGHQPMTLAQTITYIWMGQMFLSLLPWNGDREIQGMIRNGDFAYELLRPISLYGYWYMKIIAQRISATLLRAVPLLVVAALLLPSSYKMAGPASPEGFLAFILTMIIGVFLGGAISNLITISVLFTIGDGVERLFPAIVMLFSGMTIPLAFFPDWSQKWLAWLPFSGLVDVPYRYYLGLYPPENLILTLGGQIVWTLLLFLFGQMMIRRARSRIVVQGG